MIRSLVFLDPAGVWQMAFEGPALSFGRSEGNDVQLDSPQVSRRHARLELRSDDSVWIVDLGSRNGVYRNCIKVIGSSPLVNRDVLEIGTTRIRFIEVTPSWRSSSMSFVPMDDRRPPLSPPVGGRRGSAPGGGYQGRGSRSA